MTSSDLIFDGVMLCGTAVVCVIIAILGLTFGSVWLSIRRSQRTDRINELNPALSPLTVSYYWLPTRWRGTRVEYRGQVKAHAVIFYVDHISLSISVAGQYPVPVSISRAAADKTPAHPGAERRAIQLSDLHITAPDRAWCETLKADPLGGAAIVRLMADKQDLVSFIQIQPKRVLLYLTRPIDWKFRPPFLGTLDYGLFRPWIDDAVSLAEVAESLPRPKPPA